MPPLLRRCRWLDFGRKPGRLDEKARLVQAAVGAGSNSAGGETPPLQKALGITERGGEDTAPYGKAPVLG